VSGQTFSSNFPIQNPYLGEPEGQLDVFVAKLMEKFRLNYGAKLLFCFTISPGNLR
jgi:hypothetical protein